jgi:hypothetical protein
MLIVAILLVTQVTFAATKAVETKAMNRSAHLEQLSKEGSFSEISKKIKSGKALTAVEKAILTKATENSLQGVAVSAVNIQLLVQVKPEILADVRAKSDIVRSTTATKEQKEQAELDLKVLDAGARTIDVNSLTLKSDLETLEAVSRIENYPNSSVLTFKAEFIKSLDNGRSIDKAVLEASKNKFDAKKVKELCV